MSIVVLDSMSGENSLSRMLREKLMKLDKELLYMVLRDMDILPCRSCGECGFKSPGRCILKDDSHEMMKALAGCDTIILLTPVRFGGYNSVMKKAVDKFMNLCLPSYTVKAGHLLHPPRYGTKSIIGIGVYEGTSAHQEKAFHKLVENNALNLQCSYRTLILKPFSDIEEEAREISRLIKEVS